MRHDTAFAEKMRQAAPSMTEDADLYNVAIDLLRNTNGDPARATAAFVSKIFAFNLIYPLARAYLTERAAEMNGDATGHYGSDTHTIGASASPTPRDGGGQTTVDTHKWRAAPSHSSAGGESDHPALETQGPLVAPVREPSPLQRQAAGSMRLKMAETVLDTFKVRDGRAIGDLLFLDLRGLETANAREASVLRQLQEYAANVPANARVRDVVKPTDLEAMIARARTDTRVAA